MDPSWASLVKSKRTFRGLWEELKVIEGVHGPTAERFDESIDFLLDPEHVQDPKKVHAAPASRANMAPTSPTLSGSPVPAKHVCNHAEPPNKIGLLSQRTLALPRDAL